MGGWYERVDYNNYPPCYSHASRDVLKTTNQCKTPENYILVVVFFWGVVWFFLGVWFFFFTALVLVLIQCNQRSENPGIYMQIGMQR